MSGTKCQGCDKKIAWYATVCSPACAGRLGGKAKNPNKGFGSNRELASKSGAKGGKATQSKRTIKIKDVQETPDLLGFNYEVLPTEPKERSLKAKLLAKVRI